MPYETLLLSMEERVATITVSRPEKRNALSATVRREILDVLDELRDSTDVRVIIFTGAGDRAFIAGADIAEFAQRTALQQRTIMAGRRIFDEIASYPKPTIAAVNGLALGGGCELAIACDVRVAARSASFGQPEIRLGLIPGGGGTQRLPRLVGTGRALQLILTGSIISADEAYRIGLVDVLVDDADLDGAASSLGRTMAQYSPVALQLAKAAVAASWQSGLEAGLALERELFIAAFGSDDGREGVRSFLDKRPPAFTGR
jgi:enoyl-CoA hydratase